MLGRLSKCQIVSFFPELLEFSEDRHPWESVEEKLNAIRDKMRKIDGTNERKNETRSYSRNKTDYEEQR